MPSKSQCIGLIGGMSWESSVTYYQVINNVIKEELRGLHSARCLLYSVDFAEIEACQSEGRWDDAAAILADAARALESAGADFFLICTNTMHKVAEKVQEAVGIPLMHIAVETARELRRAKICKAALLGTAYTMEQEFYKDKLAGQGIEVVIPPEAQRKRINNIIFSELCLGRILPESKQFYLEVIKQLEEQGVQGIILGCTEIGLLVQQDDCDLPLFDTALIHARNAAHHSLKAAW